MIRFFKYAFALYLFAATTACKKNYSCRCTTTLTRSTRTDIYGSKTVKISEKTSKTQAEAICQHEAENINETHYNFLTNSGQWISGVTPHTNCAVE